jgi:hypothetical protein
MQKMLLTSESAYLYLIQCACFKKPAGGSTPPIRPKIALTPRGPAARIKRPAPAPQSRIRRYDLSSVALRQARRRRQCAPRRRLQVVSARPRGDRVFCLGCGYFSFLSPNPPTAARNWTLFRWVFL